MADTMTMEQVRDEMRAWRSHTGFESLRLLGWANAIDAAIKQREQDAKDAARYRWLRDFADSYTWDYLGGIGADRVEATIDAAMAKESGQ